MTREQLLLVKSGDSVLMQIWKYNFRNN